MLLDLGFGRFRVEENWGLGLKGSGIQEFRFRRGVEWFQEVILGFVRLSGFTGAYEIV